MFSSIGNALLLAFGFGFVIFFHELGHFLAAKWAGVKVEQFAVGFGQAVLSWRKGLGLRVGSSAEEFEKRLESHIEKQYSSELQLKEKTDGPTAEQMVRAASETGISETEYRLNWIPLGGYVKMLGQDDLKPGQVVNDPRSYNNKSIGKRMVIVSAGVIMNVILAAIGFMVVFLIGLPAAPAIVGGLLPGSPAQNAYKLVNGNQTPAPLQPGDRILTMDGRPQADFTKIGMNVALSEEAKPLELNVKRVDGTEEKVFAVPGKPQDEAKGFLMLGIEQPYELRGVDPGKEADKAKDELTKERHLDDLFAIKPGETIIKVAGQDVKDVHDFYMLDRAIQSSAGKPVEVTVRDASGNTRTTTVRPAYAIPFGKDPLNFAGMFPRPMVNSILEKSPAIAAGIEPGDVLTELASANPGGDRLINPTHDAAIKWINKAADNGESINVKTLRGDKEMTFAKINPNLALGNGRHGLGVGLEAEQFGAVVAGTLPDSPAAVAKIPDGAKIVSVDGKPAGTWGEVDAALKTIQASKQFNIVANVNGKDQTFTVGPLSQPQVATLTENRFTSPFPMQLALHEYSGPLAIRKTTNPAIAAQWGLAETRDAIAQVYLTVRRMTQGSVSYKNVSGPLGIFYAGYGFANKDYAWLLWFLSIISANLAVMNFLPIPIVDGGLFTFLILEKIKGGPISPKVQSIAQVVGLAILLSVFLLATYQDLLRLPIFNH